MFIILCRAEGSLQDIGSLGHGWKAQLVLQEERYSELELFTTGANGTVA